MRYSTLLGLAATASAGHVSVRLNRERFGHPLARVKRQDSQGIALEALNNITGGGYYSDFEVGTPPQTLSFLLDTGSSDTWVNSVDTDLCSSTRLQNENGYCETTCKSQWP